MRVALLAAFAIGVTTHLLSGCSSDSTSSGASTSDGGSPSTTTPDGATSSGSTSGSGADAGVTYAPSGCVLTTTGYTSGSKVENVARTDVSNAASWTDIDNALAADGKFATVTLADGQESTKLRVSGFGFAIPDIAETWGIEVDLKRQAPKGGVQDDQVNVEIEGKTSRYKFYEGDWPTTIVGTHDYGQAIDTWGVDLFPVDLNKTTFAATLTVKRAPNASGPVTAVVDSIRVAVHYCPTPLKK